MEVQSALRHGAGRVVAVELNRQLVRIVETDFSEFTGGLYSGERVDVEVAEARRFVETTNERFDLITISLLDSFISSASGAQAASESYLYTVEALAACRSRLEPGGILAVTRWIKTPPRDALRLFATLIEVARSTEGDRSREHVAGIRSWSTATLLLKNNAFTEEDIESIRGFCEARSFDPFWYAGLDESEVNRFHVLSRPIYAEGAASLLSDDRSTFIDDYPFRLDPATDDRPYFFHFFRWSTLPSFIRELGLEWIPLVEWGYLILLAVIAQAVLASSSLLILPFVFASSMRETSTMSRLRVVVYFSCLGLGYLFVEIAFIQKFALFLSHPILAVTTVLAAMLFFSGLGSLLLGRTSIVRVASAIAATLVLYPLILPYCFEILFSQSDFARVAASVVLIAPIAFLMGGPFPLGLERVKDQSPRLTPWAWSVNGFASVLGPPLATLLAMSFGFRMVLLSAAGFYLLAGLLFAKGRFESP